MWIAFVSIIGFVLFFYFPLYLLPWYVSVQLVVFFAVVDVPKLNCLRSFGLWAILRFYLDYRVITLDDNPLYFDKNKSYVFATAPHGPFCLSMILTWVSKNPYSPLSKNDDVVPLVASQLFLIPMMRFIVMALGCKSFTHDNYRTLMHCKKSVSICPGGTREMGYCSREEIKLVKRKNPKWIQYAWEEKAVIVPILSPNESDGYYIFNTWAPLRDFLQKTIHYPFVFPFGWYGTVWPKRNTKLHLHVGTFVDTSLFTSALAVEDAYYNSLNEIARKHELTLTFV